MRNERIRLILFQCFLVEHKSKKRKKRICRGLSFFSCGWIHCWRSSKHTRHQDGGCGIGTKPMLIIEKEQVTKCNTESHEWSCMGTIVMGSLLFGLWIAPALYLLWSMTAIWIIQGILTNTVNFPLSSSERRGSSWGWSLTIPSLRRVSWREQITAGEVTLWCYYKKPPLWFSIVHREDVPHMPDFPARRIPPPAPRDVG